MFFGTLFTAILPTATEEEKPSLRRESIMKSVQSGMRNYRVFVFLLLPLICISNIPRCHIICELFIADLRDHHCPEEKYEEVQQQLNCKRD